MTASSPRYTGFSLTDDLAEATNELLNLGGRQLGTAPALASIGPPLLTPSPFSLPPGGGGGATLSSLLAVGQGSRLVLIYDDDDTTSPTKQNNNSGAACPNVAEAFDEDDHLPASQLNRLVAPVSANSTYESEEVAPSPRLRQEKDRAPDKRGPHKFSEEASPRFSHTPAFFTESFPDARQDSPVISASTSENKVDKVWLPTSLQLPFSEPVRPTLSGVGDAQVIVKLHGNGRLEREAQHRIKAEQEDDMLPPIVQTECQSAQADDGDRSSLLSLAATAVTTSSQASSKARRRLVRRRSAGSTSVANEDLEILEDVPFARDVQIRGFTSVGEKSRGFVCYDVRVITIRGTTISILRRFSSFCQLRQSLLSERPQHAGLMPSLPPRRTGLFQKYASHHLEKRRRALQKWLAVVMLDRRWATTKSLREWVVGSSDEM